MLCPICKAEYRPGFSRCADCDVELVDDVPADVIKAEDDAEDDLVCLYAPKNEPELAVLKSVLDAENIPYHVRNDYFGSLETGLRIPLFNEKAILVSEANLNRATEAIQGVLASAGDEPESARYTAADKIRMGFEALFFGWLMPGTRKRRSSCSEVGPGSPMAPAVEAGPSRSCPQCGEEMLPNFTECWRCASSKQVSQEREKKPPTYTQLAWYFILVTAILSLWMLWRYTQPPILR